MWPQEEPQEKTPCAGCPCLPAALCCLLTMVLFCCGGWAAAALPPLFPCVGSWPGGLAIPRNAICELGPSPTSHLQPPLLHQTQDTRHQVSSRRSPVFPRVLPGEPLDPSLINLPPSHESLSPGHCLKARHLCLVSVTMARKSCWPGLVELPRSLPISHGVSHCLHISPGPFPLCLPLDLISS